MELGLSAAASAGRGLKGLQALSEQSIGALTDFTHPLPHCTHRLICSEDHSWFRAQQSALLQRYFGTSYQEVAPQERLIFGDYLSPGADVRPYTQVRRRSAPAGTCWQLFLDSIAQLPSSDR
jgi:hypothetical protein